MLSVDGIGTRSKTCYHLFILVNILLYIRLYIKRKYYCYIIYYYIIYYYIIYYIIIYYIISYIILLVSLAQETLVTILSIIKSGQTGPWSSAKILKKFITFSFKSIFNISNLYIYVYEVSWGPREVAESQTLGDL